MKNKVKAFIINYNRLDIMKDMADYLAQPETGCEPIIIDNNSESPRLLEYYKTCPYTVEKMSGNLGNCVLWSKESGLIERYGLEKGNFIMTDPDLDLSDIPTDFLEVLQEGLKKYEWAEKCGFSIRIDDLPDTPIAQQARGWENLNWSPHGKLDDLYFKAPIDTTFALYKNTEHNFDTCIRTAPPYCCRHLPWYWTKENIPEDEKYYFRSIGKDFNHYSKQIKDIINE